MIVYHDSSHIIVTYNFKVHVNPKIHYIFGPVVVKCLLWISKNCFRISNRAHFLVEKSDQSSKIEHALKNAISARDVSGGTQQEPEVIAALYLLIFRGWRNKPG